MYSEDFHEIEPQLYLGCYEAIFGKPFQHLQVTCIIALTPFEETPYTLPITCYRYPLTSKSTLEEIKQVIHQVYEVLLKHPNENIYVHCYEGVSRSAICLIYYIHKKYNFTIEDAFHFVKQKRSIYPKDIFIQAVNQMGGDRFFQEAIGLLDR
jgi:dual specificity phosphatase 12